MKRTVIPAALIVAVLGVAAISGCSSSGAEPLGPIPPVGGDQRDDAPASHGDGDDLDAWAEAPPECAAAGMLWAGPADISAVESKPAEWPEPPTGAVLCLTSGTAGSAESATYATTSPIESVFAHYENALTAYDLARTDGADNGTGYATLDGAGAVDFQIRETDGGFVLVFAAHP